jgi:CotS family spore coat protein
LELNQEPLNEVLSNYNITVLNILNESYKEKKGVWRINTSNGNKIPKKMSNSEATLKFIIAGINHLIRNGIKIPQIIKTKSNMSYVKNNEICFILSDEIEGIKPTYDSLQELEMIAKELGKFHKASSGFIYPYDAKPKNHLGTWIEEYTNYLENMNKFYIQERQRKIHNDIGNLIIKEFPYFHERGRKAVEGLKGSEYREWVVKINNNGCLCHQDFSSANLLNTRDGIYILDTDSLAIDLPARDIRKLLNKIMKKSGTWDFEKVKRIIGWYNQKNPLSPSEWKVVIFDLMFPHLFLGAMDKYYYQRDKTWKDENYLYRINEMIAFEKTLISITKNFNSLIPYVKK